MSKWQQGFTYVGKAVEGQIERVDSGSMVAKVRIEVTKGPLAGQSIWYQGWITGSNGRHSPDNAARTSEELRAMGASLRNGWNDLSGLGAREVQFTAKGETVSKEGRIQTFWRAAFVQLPKAMSSERRVTEADLAALPLPPPPPASNGRSHAAEPADEYEEAADPGQDADFP